MLFRIIVRAMKVIQHFLVPLLMAFLYSPALSRAEEFDFGKTKAAAEKGDAEGEFLFGKAYFKGEGVPKDFEKAAELYGKAAEQGNAKAQYAVGFLYALGEGVNRDEK